jgi:DNA-directed RNA polymerase specialized sigma24 family protein
MTLETEIDDALHESFRAALVLTGSIEGAERAVTDAIASLGPDCSEDELMAQTARFAFEHTTSSDELSSCLPAELQALSRIPPARRYCFVLRILLGLDVETCCEILTLSRHEVEEALYRSLLDLPRAVESIRCI